MKNKTIFLPVMIAVLLAVSCRPTPKQYQMGTFGYDKAFFEKHNVEYLELKSSDGQSKLLVVPAWQGRVMTSSAGGDKGRSYGWINYSFIESGEVDPQFNVFGGEERFWLGPEGGPFSIYFKEGDEQVFTNWVVPPVIDTEAYDYEILNEQTVKFSKKSNLINASGTRFQLGIERTVSLLSRDKVASLLNVEVPEGLRVVAYETDNRITNLGDKEWTREDGLLSIWMLCMFNPSPETTVFIPFNPDAEGVIVNDDYFGNVPADRLIVDRNTVYFKIDGEYRSKIGIPPARAKELCGSYDSGSKVLTLLWCSLPEEPMDYVNSKWGQQDDPYSGDAINSYNDGPVEDGSIMGPFYEIETSSPAAALQPSETMKHVERLMHFEGDEALLAKMVKSLFDLDLNDIANKF